MRMLILVYNHLLDEQIRQVLSDNDVKGYSEVPRVFGAGETGMVADSRHAPGYNCCLFAAVPEERIEPLNREFHRLADQFAREYGRPMQLRIFSTPCEQLL